MSFFEHSYASLNLLSLPKDVTIPFPSALLVAKPSEMGTLRTWDTFFQIEIGNFKLNGKLLEGQYPNWRGVIPGADALNYSITLDELNANVEEFRNKLKLLLDESAALTRKVKEVALVQKQKERDFIPARRAIERIRMAI